VFSTLSLYDATLERYAAGQALFSAKKQLHIKVMIHYAEINTEHQTTQMLTAGRSSAAEHAGGSDSESLAVAACQSCGAAGSGDHRL
jgi:ATP-dependent protease Clp ATPase subunit